METRLETLENKLAHLELAVDELNQVVYRQSKELETAQRLTRHLQARVRDLLEKSQEAPYSIDEERPPHY